MTVEIIANVRTTTVTKVLRFLALLQVVSGVSGGKDWCIFDFERESLEGPYAFSYLAEESPIPEGKDYHVRIPVIKTNDGNRTCSVGLKLPEIDGEERFLALHPGKQCKNPVRGNKVHQIQYTLI